MSLDATKWAWGAPVVNSGQRLVLLNLADRANKGGKCWPSQKRIARDTYLGERTVRARLAELEGLRLISRTHRDRGTGKTSDMITLLIDGNTNGQVAKTATPGPAANAATHRQILPPATGTSRRLINQRPINQTEPNIPIKYPIWLELMPMPARPDIDRHNRAVAFATDLSKSIKTADWNSVGFESLELVEGWLERIHVPELRRSLVQTDALADRAGTKIRSWHYFAKAVEKLPNKSD